MGGVFITVYPWETISDLKKAEYVSSVMAQRQDVITGDRGEEKKVGSKDMFFLCIPSLPSGDRMAR